MPTERAEFVISAYALDWTFVGHVNAADVDQFVATHFIDDTMVLRPNAPLVPGAQPSSGMPTTLPRDY